MKKIFIHRYWNSLKKVMEKCYLLILMMNVFQQLNFSYKNVPLLKNDIYEISVLGRRVVL